MRPAAQVLVVMGRYPVPGAVKTRLAVSVGAQRACTLYAAFLRDIAARLEDLRWQTVWAVDPPGSDLQDVVGRATVQIDQIHGSLGERMLDCFKTLFGGGAERVVMIGADAPHLAPATVANAFTALQCNDVVLVPTADGGYCLVGLREPVDLFTAVPMSTAQVMAETCERISALQLSQETLAESFDVDGIQDVIRLRNELVAGQIVLPASAAVLEEWEHAGILPFS